MLDDIENRFAHNNPVYDAIRVWQLSAGFS